MKRFLLLALAIVVSLSCSSCKGQAKEEQPNITEQPSPKVQASETLTGSCEEARWESQRYSLVLTAQGELRVFDPHTDGANKELLFVCQYEPATARKVLTELIQVQLQTEQSKVKGATLTLTDKEGKCNSVKVKTSAGKPLFQLLPHTKGQGPEQCWIAGTLQHEDLEGGLWRLNGTVNKDQFSFVLRPSTGSSATIDSQIAEAKIKDGDEVFITGKPVPAEEGFGIHMAGEYYEVLSILPPASMKKYLSSSALNNKPAGYIIIKDKNGNVKKVPVVKTGKRKGKSKTGKKSKSSRKSHKSTKRSSNAI